MCGIGNNCSYVKTRSAKITDRAARKFSLTIYVSLTIALSSMKFDPCLMIKSFVTEIRWPETTRKWERPTKC